MSKDAEKPSNGAEDADERRQHTRYRLRLPVNVRFESTRKWSSAVLMDLSASGFLLRTSARSVPGNAILIKFKSCDGEYEVEGSVVRAPCIPQPGGFAVQFTPDSGLDALLEEVDNLPAEERAAFLATELRPFIEVKGG